MYLSLNRINSALEDFKEAHELDPGNPEHLKKYNEVLSKQQAKLE